MIYANFGNIKSERERNRRVERISGLQAVVETWNHAFHCKGKPRDIVYVAQVQEKVRELRKELDK